MNKNKFTIQVQVISDGDIEDLTNMLKGKGIDVELIYSLGNLTTPLLNFKDTTKKEEEKKNE